HGVVRDTQDRGVTVPVPKDSRASGHDVQEKLWMSGGRINTGAELTFPFRNHGAGETVADNVDGGAAHIQNRVGAEQNGDAFERESESGECTGKNDERGAWNTCNTFGCHHDR